MKRAKHMEDKDIRSKNEDEEHQGGSLLSEILEYVRIFAITLILLFLVQHFLIVNARIPSGSMEPTVQTGDQIFGNRLAYKKKDPQRLDIVIFRYPDDERRLFIKRIIGLPGDVIDIRDGQVYVNEEDTPLPDDYVMPGAITEPGLETFPLVVPEDSYFLLGDNRENSRDSRFWEHPFVRKDKILGKAVFRYWPLSRIGSIPKASSGS